MTTSIRASLAPVALQRPETAERSRPTGRPWWNVVPTSDTADGPVELLIFDYIDSWGGDWGVSATELVEALRPHASRDIVVRINSGGGEVFDGVAIYNALLRHEGRVDVVIDGLAASAASFIAMAGDTVTMMRSATMMIHDASGLALGNAATMREMADVLDKLSNTIADTYARRSGAPVADWRERMLEETWLTATEALDLGLVDAVGDPERGRAAEPTDRAPEVPAAPTAPAARPGSTADRDRAAARIRVRQAQGRNPA